LSAGLCPPLWRGTPSPAQAGGTAAYGGTAGSRWHRGSSEMLATILVLLALGGVAARCGDRASDNCCLYTPDANGHVVVPDGVTSLGNQAFDQDVNPWSFLPTNARFIE